MKQEKRESTSSSSIEVELKRELQLPARLRTLCSLGGSLLLATADDRTLRVLDAGNAEVLYNATQRGSNMFSYNLIAMQESLLRVLLSVLLLGVGMELVSWWHETIECVILHPQAKERG